MEAAERGAEEMRSAIGGEATRLQEAALAALRAEMEAAAARGEAERACLLREKSVELRAAEKEAERRVAEVAAEYGRKVAELQAEVTALKNRARLREKMLQVTRAPTREAGAATGKGLD